MDLKLTNVSNNLLVYVHFSIRKLKHLLSEKSIQDFDEQFLSQLLLLARPYQLENRNTHKLLITILKIYGISIK